MRLQEEGDLVTIGIGREEHREVVTGPYKLNLAFSNQDVSFDVQE